MVSPRLAPVGSLRFAGLKSGRALDIAHSSASGLASFCFDAGGLLSPSCYPHKVPSRYETALRLSRRTVIPSRESVGLN